MLSRSNKPAARANANPDSDSANPAHPPAPTPTLTAPAAATVRDLFWQNVVREMLMSLPVAAAHSPSIFDGRIGVVTRQGQRIPISAVHPLFACSVPGLPLEQALANAVQCTVFEIRTPTGEIYTLPLDEIRGVHAMSEDLMQQLEAAAGESAAPGDAQPFGFAAFTQLARQRRNEAEVAADPMQGAI